MTTIETSARFRTATVDDAALLAKLGARLFEETFGPVNDPADMKQYLAESFGEPIQRAELENRNRVALIAEDAAATPIGYAMLALGARAEGVAAERPAEIQRFYVDRPWQGRGVAQAMMEACFSKCVELECDLVWLAVWEENPRAITFYERMGFQRVSKKTFLLGRDVQHDLVMIRPLTER